jgi:hemerythrin
MNANEQAFECSALPEVAMPFMNSVHCAELMLVGKLLAAVQSNAATATVDSLLAEWVEHTKVHFAREERLMTEYNFFATPCHQGEHERALLELLGVQQQWLRERDEELLPAYIQHWREWLQQHVSTMDFVTAQFLSQFNFTVEL